MSAANALVAVVGEENVIADETRLSDYVRDYSPFAPVTPKAVVRPSTAEEVADVLRIASRQGQKVLIRGGGASFTGYVFPYVEETIVLETTRMNRIIEVNEDDMTVSAECGTVLWQLEQEVARKGLYVNTVTTPVRYSTLGGILSGVTGGGLPVRGASVGNDVGFLLGLKVVLPSGTMVKTGATGSNVNCVRNFMKGGGNGPDIGGMFVGDGGYLGVKVEATVQVFPERKLSEAGCWTFGRLEDVWSATRKMNRLDPLPYSQLKVRDVRGEMQMFYVVEERSQARMEIAVEEIERVAAECGGSRASSELQEFAKRYGEFMRGDDRVKSPKGMLAYFVPNSRFLEVYGAMNSSLAGSISKRELSRKGVSFASTFRPNSYNGVYINTMIAYDEGNEEGKDGVKQLLLEGYARAVELGCCPEPHQGHGSPELSGRWSAEYRDLFRSIKQLVDPDNTLNPGLWGER